MDVVLVGAVERVVGEVHEMLPLVGLSGGLVRLRAKPRQSLLHQGDWRAWRGWEGLGRVGVLFENHTHPLTLHKNSSSGSRDLRST